MLLCREEQSIVIHCGLSTVAIQIYNENHWTYNSRIRSLFCHKAGLSEKLVVHTSLQTLHTHEPQGPQEKQALLRILTDRGHQVRRSATAQASAVRQGTARIAGQMGQPTQ